MESALDSDIYNKLNIKPATIEKENNSEWNGDIFPTKDNAIKRVRDSIKSEIV
jgi:hypothetical protein